MEHVMNVTHLGIFDSHLTRFDFQWIRLVDCEQQVLLFVTGTIDNQWVFLRNCWTWIWQKIAGDYETHPDPPTAMKWALREPLNGQNMESFVLDIAAGRFERRRKTDDWEVSFTILLHSSPAAGFLNNWYWNHPFYLSQFVYYCN